MRAHRVSTPGAVVAGTLAAMFAALAGCAAYVAPRSAPAPVSTWAPPQPEPPAAPVAPPAIDPDEAFHGVRFGASRADVLRAYPGAACTAQQCTGSTQLFGLPATFFVFAQADGSWAARLSLPESTVPGANFNRINDGLSARYRHEEVVIEDHGNRFRWHPDAARPRQIVLRRCGADEKCRGLDHGVIELAFFEQGTPLGHGW
jgi:hypothetical protein